MDLQDLTEVEDWYWTEVAQLFDAYYLGFFSIAPVVFKILAKAQEDV